MSKRKKEEKVRARMEHEACCCPFCLSKRMMQDVEERYSGFFTHLRNARLEILRALRTLVDKRISSLEQEKKTVTRVKVE